MIPKNLILSLIFVFLCSTKILAYNIYYGPKGGEHCISELSRENDASKIYLEIGKNKNSKKIDFFSIAPTSVTSKEHNGVILATKIDNKNYCLTVNSEEDFETDKLNDIARPQDTEDTNGYQHWQIVYLEECKLEETPLSQIWTIEKDCPEEDTSFKLSGFRSTDRLIGSYKSNSDGKTSTLVVGGAQSTLGTNNSDFSISGDTYRDPIHALTMENILNISCKYNCINKGNTIGKEPLGCGKFIESKNKTICAFLQPDSNFVIYKANNNYNGLDPKNLFIALNATGCSPKEQQKNWAKNGRVCMKEDGSLVVENTDLGSVKYKSDTDESMRGSVVHLSNDGELILTSPSGKTKKLDIKQKPKPDPKPEPKPVYKGITKLLVNTYKNRRWKNMGTTLRTGDIMERGYFIVSENNQYALVYQYDGNLVVYKNHNGKMTPIQGANKWKPSMIKANRNKPKSCMSFDHGQLTLLYGGCCYSIGGKLATYDAELSITNRGHIKIQYDNKDSKIIDLQGNQLMRDSDHY